VKRIEGGAQFDVAILTPAALAALAAKAHVMGGSIETLSKVGVGVAVRSGAPKPDISTVDAFRATLLAAKSVAYIDPAAGGSSGIYFNELIGRLGIADAVRAKARLLPGGYVAELVAKGEAELAVHQISEIVPVAGVDLVGPLPAEVQRITTYAGAIGSQTKVLEAAKALLAYLAGPVAAPVLARKGMHAP
jgi:molybdate transport system substrate-binding protein